jgi:hypothetical protein
MRFAAEHPCWVTMALMVGGWQMRHQSALVCRFCLPPARWDFRGGVGLSYIAWAWNDRDERRGNRIRGYGPGPTLVPGFVTASAGCWRRRAGLAARPAMFGLMLMLFESDQC